MNATLPVAIIGAGPVGLAAAAHLAERGESFVALEAGPAVGHAMRQWGHVRVFSPWRYNVDRAARRLLEASGWQHPDPEALPTSSEIVARYLEPLAAVHALKRCIRLAAQVTAVGRRDYDKAKTCGRDQQPFAIRITPGRGDDYELLARAVIDTSGTWLAPNPLGSRGYSVPGEAAARDAITYGIPDILGAERAAYAGKTTLVAGSEHSAINTVLNLVSLAGQEPDTEVVWAVRRTDFNTVFGGGAADALEARGALGTSAQRLVNAGRVEVLAPFRGRAVRQQMDGRLAVIGVLSGHEKELQVDRIVVATGFRPDFSFLREIRLSVNPWLEATEVLAPLIAPNLHSRGTVHPHGAGELAHPEKDFYIAGMKSYGSAPTFLLATGYEQVRSIVAALVGDHEAAARLELELPETGVCSSATGLGVTGEPCCGPKKDSVVPSIATGCCGGPTPKGTDACCVADVEAKAAGDEGCGCSSTSSLKVTLGATRGCC